MTEKRNAYEIVGTNKIAIDIMKDAFEKDRFIREKKERKIDELSRKIEITQMKIKMSKSDVEKQEMQRKISVLEEEKTIVEKEYKKISDEEHREKYNAYLKTPSNFNIIDIFLSEIGLERPNISKPDWDNIGKKYCDMYNHNIWLDDSMVITGTVNKYYSILPRVEIILRYLNVVYNKYQYNMVVNRKDYDGKELHYLDNEGNIV